MEQKIDISVVVPLFNEEESLPELVNWIKKVMKTHQFTYEIILVDNNSDDHAALEYFDFLDKHDEKVMSPAPDDVIGAKALHQ